MCPSLVYQYYVLFTFGHLNCSDVIKQAVLILVVCLEPVCAIGMGVAGLFSATNRDGSWKLKGYSMTSVSCFCCIIIIYLTTVWHFSPQTACVNLQRDLYHT